MARKQIPNPRLTACIKANDDNKVRLFCGIAKKLKKTSRLFHPHSIWSGSQPQTIANTTGICSLNFMRVPNENLQRRLAGRQIAPFRASRGQNSEAAHPANRKRRLLGTRHGRLLVLSCLTFGSCRIGLLQAAPSGNHACWDFFFLAFLVPEDFLNWLE